LLAVAPIELFSEACTEATCPDSYPVASRYRREASWTCESKF